MCLIQPFKESINYKYLRIFSNIYYIREYEHPAVERYQKSLPEV